MWMKLAETTGSVIGAFALRIRTPLLKASVMGTKVTPHEAEAERRTAANAIFQSWCMLTTRAGIEVGEEIRKSRYKYIISPCAMIHDALYFLVRDDIDTFVWLHQKVLKAIEWQEDPVIAHDRVHLCGELALYHPDWSNEIKIPNDVAASPEETINVIKQGVNEYNKSHKTEIPF